MYDIYILLALVPYKYNLWLSFGQKAPEGKSPDSSFTQALTTQLLLYPRDVISHCIYLTCFCLLGWSYSTAYSMQCWQFGNGGSFVEDIIGAATFCKEEKVIK